MKFEKLRTLKNHVFSSTIKRVEDEDQDCLIAEKNLEDDFGYVEVKLGGKFEAVIEKDEENEGKLKVTPVTSKNREALKEKINFKFALKETMVQLKMNSAMTFSCNAKEEISRVFDEITMSSIQIAEMKCTMFEEIMLDKVGLAIEQWKKKGTTFEQEVLDEVHFSLR